MQSEQPRASQLSISAVMLKSLGLFLLLLPLLATIYRPQLMVASDYLMNFFVAGKLILAGHPDQLYPGPTETSFLTTAFNQAAHRLLPGLPPGHISIYMYSPLTAVVFAPFGLFDAQASLFAWQVASIAAFFVSALLIGRAARLSFGEAIKHSLFYLPVIQTILIGHIGLVLGLLPLALGFHSLCRERPLRAGLYWSLLLLKPQFLPVVLLVAGSLLFNRRPRCAAGLALGGIAVAGSTVLALTPSVSLAWLSTFKLSDSVLSDPIYGYPKYLVCSLPAAVVQLVPVAQRSIAKAVTYSLVVCVSLHALWTAIKVIKQKAVSEEESLVFVFALGIGVLPLVLPHFLVYDLVVLAAFGIIARGFWWQERERLMLVSNHWLYLIAVNVYVCLFMFTDKKLAQPLALVAVMIFLYLRLLWLARVREAGPALDAAIAGGDKPDSTSSESKPEMI